MTKKVVKKPSVALHYTLLGLYLVPCSIVFGAGLILCCTIVGIAPGGVLMGLSAIPIAAESNRYILAKRRWQIKQEGPEKFRKGHGKRNQVVLKIGDVSEYEYDPDLDQMVPIEKPWVVD